jgi:hypothetical protein
MYRQTTQEEMEVMSFKIVDDEQLAQEAQEARDRAEEWLSMTAEEQAAALRSSRAEAEAARDAARELES